MLEIQSGLFPSKAAKDDRAYDSKSLYGRFERKNKSGKFDPWNQLRPKLRELLKNHYSGFRYCFVRTRQQWGDSVLYVVGIVRKQPLPREHAFVSLSADSYLVCVQCSRTEQFFKRLQDEWWEKNKPSFQSNFGISGTSISPWRPFEPKKAEPSVQSAVRKASTPRSSGRNKVYERTTPGYIVLSSKRIPKDLPVDVSAVETHLPRKNYDLYVHRRIPSFRPASNSTRFVMGKRRIEKKPFGILKILLRNRGTQVSPVSLYREVWQPAAEDSPFITEGFAMDYVKVAAAKIRALRKNLPKMRLAEKERIGVGYAIKGDFSFCIIVPRE